MQWNGERLQELKTAGVIFKCHTFTFHRRLPRRRIPLRIGNFSVTVRTYEPWQFYLLHLASWRPWIRAR